MTDTLNVTTMIGVPIASTAGGSLLTDTATAYKADDDGHVTESKIKPKGAIASTAAGVFTTVAYAVQEASEAKTLAEINNAQAVVESMTEEELTAALIRLGELEPSESSNTDTKTL